MGECSASNLMNLDQSAQAPTNECAIKIPDLSFLNGQHHPLAVVASGKFLTQPIRCHTFVDAVVVKQIYSRKKGYEGLQPERD